MPPIWPLDGGHKRRADDAERREAEERRRVEKERIENDRLQQQLRDAEREKALQANQFRTLLQDQSKDMRNEMEERERRNAEERREMNRRQAEQLEAQREQSERAKKNFENTLDTIIRDDRERNEKSEKRHEEMLKDKSKEMAEERRRRDDQEERLRKEEAKERENLRSEHTEHTKDLKTEFDKERQNAKQNADTRVREVKDDMEKMDAVHKSHELDLNKQLEVTRETSQKYLDDTVDRMDGERCRMVDNYTNQLQEKTADLERERREFSDREAELKTEYGRQQAIMYEGYQTQLKALTDAKEAEAERIAQTHDKSLKAIEAAHEKSAETTQSFLRSVNEDRKHEREMIDQKEARNQELMQRMIKEQQGQVSMLFEQVLQGYQQLPSSGGQYGDQYGPRGIEGSREQYAIGWGQQYSEQPMHSPQRTQMVSNRSCPSPRRPDERYACGPLQYQDEQYHPRHPEAYYYRQPGQYPGSDPGVHQEHHRTPYQERFERDGYYRKEEFPERGHFPSQMPVREYGNTGRPPHQSGYPRPDPKDMTAEQREAGNPRVRQAGSYDEPMGQQGRPVYNTGNDRQDGYFTQKGNQGERGPLNSAGNAGFERLPTQQYSYDDGPGFSERSGRQPDAGPEPPSSDRRYDHYYDPRDLPRGLGHFRPAEASDESRVYDQRNLLRGPRSLGENPGQNEARYGPGVWPGEDEFADSFDILSTDDK
ncbi:hypothetical protein BaRGS_00023588 [Batillaria attramentaria]|uniref:Uncharacterized protein n=1 Tax=Batillaria attramentaria TaxID=370345 RepID=A0ABD0KDM2_9CAEN